MLQIMIPEMELYNEDSREFVKTKSETLQLEHSLVSLSKWESKWCKPFLGKESKTANETVDYIRCMTITQNVSSDVYSNLPKTIFDKITEYIDAPMTATWFSDKINTKRNTEIVTAEIIYYWMIIQHIPMECQEWHLNRLLTLIRVCSIKNQPPKKTGYKEMLSNRRTLNEARRSQFNTKG